MSNISVYEPSLPFKCRDDFPLVKAAKSTPTFGAKGIRHNCNSSFNCTTHLNRRAHLAVPVCTCLLSFSITLAKDDATGEIRSENNKRTFGTFRPNMKCRQSDCQTPYRRGQVRGHVTGMTRLCSLVLLFVLFLFLVLVQDQLQQKIVCPGVVTCLNASPDGLFLAAAVAEAIYLWEVGQFLHFSEMWKTIKCLCPI